jgi:hypothetical protein
VKTFKEKMNKDKKVKNPINPKLSCILSYQVVGQLFMQYFIKIEHEIVDIFNVERRTSVNSR